MNSFKDKNQLLFFNLHPPHSLPTLKVFFPEQVGCINFYDGGDSTGFPISLCPECDCLLRYEELEPS